MKLGIATLNSSQHQQIVFDLNASELNSNLAAAAALSIGQNNSCDVFIDGDAGISLHHCELKWEQASSIGQFELINHGQSIVLEDATRLHRGQSLPASLPLAFSIGDTRVQVFAFEEHGIIDESLAWLPPIGENPRRPPSAATKQPSSIAPRDSFMRQAEQVSPAPSTLAAWLEAVGALQKSVAGSQTFFKEAAKAIFNPGGLDGCFILMPTETASSNHPQSTWKIVTSHIPLSDSSIHFRSDLVNRAVEQGLTLFHDTSQIDNARLNENNGKLQTVVVSPVVSNDGEVMAVVYGFRNRNQRNLRLGTRTIEAQFVQLIANTILSAMTRHEKEAEATKARFLLQQAFSPKVARHLEADPQVLDGRTSEVTVLFADLRNFSSISDVAGPKLTYQMLTDFMDQFTEIVLQQDGVVIDYFGDGLSAFWNAPIPQENHVLLACQAAEQMIERMPTINEIWAHRLPQSLRVGVGIHTGVAQVGNSGSTNRIKYGPRGSTVNIASRLETATKSVGLPLIVSESVARSVAANYFARRICNTKLAGIHSPMNLFELFPRPIAPGVSDALETYARCLEMYELNQFHDAITSLCQLNLDMPDQATAFLLEQAMSKNSHHVDRRKSSESKHSITALTRRDRAEKKTSPAS